MSRQTYNHQTITAYLLGSLPEAEAERFDELSFTDDEFAGALSAAENDLVDAYVQGELDGAALERFKSHYLSSPLGRRKVEFARAFQSAAGLSAAPQAAEVRAEVADKSRAKRKGSGWFSALSALAAPRPALGWGAACAALALLVAVAWLAFDDARLRGQLSRTLDERDEVVRREAELRKEFEGRRAADALARQESAREEGERSERGTTPSEAQEQTSTEQQRAPERRGAPPGGLSIASFVLAPQTRGAGQLATVSVPARTDYVSMRLELEPNTYTAYRVALLDGSGRQTLWRSGRLKARAQGGGKTLGVSFGAGLLRPQTYVLRVTGVAADGASETVGDYPFRVVKQ